MTATPPPAGLRITALPPDDAAALAESACSTTQLPLDPGLEVNYAVAEFDHCYNVARRDESGDWTWASAVFTGAPTLPASAPPHQLIRLRVFGAATDIVVTADGEELLGARLDADSTAALPAPLQPRPRHYLLVDSAATTRQARDGFTLLTHASGRSQVIPHTFDPTRTPLGDTCEYFTADPDTGAVTVTAVTWTGFSDGDPIGKDPR